MSGTEIVGQEQRDEQIAEALTAGRSMRSGRREFSLTEGELDAALERLWPVDTEARLRMIKHDVGCLQRLIQIFHEKALGGCVQSGLCTVRLYERLHSLIGADAVRQVDLTIIRPPQAKSSHQRVVDAINAMWDRLSPAEKAVRERLNQISAEQALELLGPPQPKGGNGAAAVPSDADPDRH